jgi:hypothetical protein
MSESMVERVARAIFETRRMTKAADGTWDEALKGHAMKLPASFEIVELARAEARAAIEAMREPTEAMISGGFNEAHKGHVIGTWVTMIDAALTPAKVDEAG